MFRLQDIIFKKYHISQNFSVTFDITFFMSYLNNKVINDRQ